VFCPLKFCIKSPFGSFQSLMLSVEPEANILSVGCNARERTLFCNKKTSQRGYFLVDLTLWFVREQTLFPLAKSHRRMVESWLPVITCGFELWQATEATVSLWPLKQNICAFVRISQTFKWIGKKCWYFTVDIITSVNPGSGVTSACNKNINWWMESQILDRTQMSMIMPDHFVLFQIPAFNLRILCKSYFYFWYISMETCLSSPALNK
jgi:hypothetical protein